jgi:hypothetical protein
MDLGAGSGITGRCAMHETTRDKAERMIRTEMSRHGCTEREAVNRLVCREARETFRCLLTAATGAGIFIAGLACIQAAVRDESLILAIAGGLSIGCGIGHIGKVLYRLAKG